MSGTLSSISGLLAALNPRQASWRGVPFSVLQSEAEAGRQIAEHLYPYRQQDPVWPEDLGIAPRGVAVVGYLVGDDVASQRDAMMAACEQEGSGELVHPTLGRMTVSLAQRARFSERFDERRVVRVTFLFVQAGERLYPTSAKDTQSATKSAADDADSAAASDFSGALQATSPEAATTVASTGTSSGFFSGVGSTLSAGVAAARQAATTVGQWASMATRLVGDASRAVNSVSALAGIAGIGNLGRYLSGPRSSSSSLTGITSLAGGVSAVISRATSARTAVTSAASDVTRLVGSL